MPVLEQQPTETVEVSEGLAARVRTRLREVSRLNPKLKSVRAYSNWARSNYELAVGASKIRARPLKLTLDPTNVCQLKCPLCPTGIQAHDRERGHASLEMFKRLLDELGEYLFFIDFFNWGEPLLNTHLEDFIELASARRIICNISSNLSLPLSEERIERLIGSGLNELIVSFDGASRETYATYRRKGDFDLVYTNMRRIVEAKRRLGIAAPLITWQFLVFRFNQHEIGKARSMAEEIGVDRIIFRAPFLDVDRYPISEKDRKIMADWAPETGLVNIASTQPAADSKPKSRCGWHYMSAAVNWDGSVSPCCTTFETRDDFGSLGKAGETAYMDVVNNPNFVSVRDRFAGRDKKPSPLICEKCPTPLIMDYHKFLNRQIVLYTLAGLAGYLTKPFTRRAVSPKTA